MQDRNQTQDPGSEQALTFLRISTFHNKNKFSIECAFPDSQGKKLKSYKSKEKGFRLKATEDGIALCCEFTNNPLHLSEFIRLIVKLTNQDASELYRSIDGISEKDAQEKIAELLKENQFDQAIAVALKAQEYGHFNPIWDLARQLELSDSAETFYFEKYFNVYQDISENSDFYLESRKHLAAIMLCIEPQGKDAKAREMHKIDLLEKALNFAIDSTHQPLIDRIFDLLCGRNSITPLSAHMVSDSADSLIKEAAKRRARKFYTGMWKNEQKEWNKVQTNSTLDGQAGPGYGF